MASHVSRNKPLELAHCAPDSQSAMLSLVVCGRWDTHAMNNRLRNVLVPTAAVSVAAGILAGIPLLARAALSVPFDGIELFLWAAFSMTTFVVALAAEIVPGRFRLKYFLLGSLAPTVFLGCALLGSWVRTGQSPRPDATAIWVIALIVIAGGLVVHFSARSKQT